MNPLVLSKMHPVNSLVLSEMEARAIENPNLRNSLSWKRKARASNSLTNTKKNPNAGMQLRSAVDNDNKSSSEGGECR